MSLHIFLVVLISISYNADSFAVAIADGIEQVRITHLANFTIATISSIGTFASMSIGSLISDRPSRSAANTLGSDGNILRPNITSVSYIKSEPIKLSVNKNGI